MVSPPLVHAEARQPKWVCLLAPATSICALGTLGFAYAAVLLSYLGGGGKVRDVALFIGGAVLLPFVCAAIQGLLVRPNFQHPRSESVETVNCWAAIALLLALALLPIVMYVAGRPADFWFQNSKRMVVAVAVLHVAGLSVAMLQESRQGLTMLKTLDSRTVQTTILVLVFFAASFSLYWIDPSDRYLNHFVRLFIEPPFSKSPARSDLGSR